MPLPPGIAGFEAGQQANAFRQQQEMQQAQMRMTLGDRLRQQQEQSQARQIIDSGAPPEQVVQALLKLGPNGAQMAHQYASAVKDLEASRASQSLRNLTPEQLQNPDTLDQLGASGRPGTAHFTGAAERIRRRNETEAALKSMRRTPGDNGELTGGHFSTLMQSEFPAIANQAKTLQSQLDLPNNALPPQHWMEQQRQLAAKETAMIEMGKRATAKAAPAGEVTAGLSEQYHTDPEYKKNVNFWAEVLKNGGSLPPRFAQSGAGKKMMPDIVNIVPSLGTSREVLANQVDLTGQKSQARAVGTRAAAVELAAGEAREMMPILQEASENFKRTGWMPLNRVWHAYSTNTGSVEARQLGAALNSFVNVYARAVSPTGQATVSDKDHARELLSTADSHEQLLGLLKILDREMVAAQNSPRNVRAAQRAEMTGTKPSSEVRPTAVDAALDKYK